MHIGLDFIETHTATAASLHSSFMFSQLIYDFFLFLAPRERYSYKTLKVTEHQLSYIVIDVNFYN